MKVTIRFYEIKDSDYTGIHLYTPHSVYTNQEPDAGQLTWCNQTIESEVDEIGLTVLIQSLDLKFSHARTLQAIHVINEGEEDEREDELTEVVCPYCNLSVAHDEWTPRHKMDGFDVLEWKTDVYRTNDFSEMKCNQCDETFLLEWDFKNNEL